MVSWQVCIKLVSDVCENDSAATRADGPASVDMPNVIALVLVALSVPPAPVAVA